MLINVIDERKRKYRFKKINAVIESAWHDNRCKDADQIKKPRGGDKWIGYDEVKHTTVENAMKWAAAFELPVTLYLYDKDRGIYPVKTTRRKK